MDKPNPNPFAFIAAFQNALVASQLARIDADAEMLELTLRRTAYGPDLDACLAIVQRLHVASRANVLNGFKEYQERTGQ